MNGIGIYPLIYEGEDERELRLLVEYIRRPPRCGVATVRQVQRSRGEKYSTADSARHALEVLIRAGLGRWRGKDEFQLNTNYPTPDNPTAPGEPGETKPEASEPRS